MDYQLASSLNWPTYSIANLKTEVPELANFGQNAIRGLFNEMRRGIGIPIRVFSPVIRIEQMGLAERCTRLFCAIFVWAPLSIFSDEAALLFDQAWTGNKISIHTSAEELRDFQRVCQNLGRNFSSVTDLDNPRHIG